MFIPMKQTYHNLETGELGTDYVSLLPKKLTLNKKFVASRFKERTRRTTLFREVVTARLGDVLTPELRELFHVQPVVRHDLGELLSELRGLLRDAIERSWRPGLFHVVMHSSGYDSRMISWTIKSLVEEHGEGWLGPGLLFLCSIREGSEFKKIMRYEGWAEHQYAVVNEGVKENEYYARSLTDFGRAWRRLGGVSAIPVNLFWYPVEWARNVGFMPDCDEWQMYTGQWGNTVGNPASAFGRHATFKEAYILFYYSVLFQRSFYCADLVHPFADYDIANLVCGMIKPEGLDVRKALLESMDGKLLRGFRNVASNGDREMPIAPGVAQQIAKDYDSSWYGKKVRPGKRPSRWWTEFCPFWSHWSAASLCEHLLAAGHEIKVGR